MLHIIAFGVALAVPSAGADAQTTASAPPAAHAPAPAGAVPLPAGYVFGADDVIGVLFWREPDMSGDVIVRPDGLIGLPLLGDVPAAGRTPDQLKTDLQQAAARFITDPNVTILVKQINSRKVFITGEVTTPGAYPLTAPRTVMQLIALAGGLKEYADSKNITIMRTENGRQKSYKFNYNTVAQGKALPQNIQLQPGDTVIVP
jgi:polysaccharide export outer membrane protein